MNRIPKMPGDLYLFPVAKKEVKKLDILRLLSAIRHMETMQDNGFQKLMITFSGWDDNPNDIYEIPEIRAWVKMVVERMPHIFYFITDIEKMNSLVACCYFDVLVHHEGEKLTEKEWAERGQFTVDSRPTNRIAITWDKEKLAKIHKGLLDYGETIGQLDLANKAFRDITADKE
ncbi:hypothetical protein ACTFR8_23455 [Bacillus cereus group sp. MYBK15-3]|uniref:hypothetical protein n=1 Tax=Bacillus cereus group TaxID=86661 RepID=UPI001C8CE674|nr:hypothetical protein [Bacillus cereus]MBX9158556.1 hypothetical protein [Bacillus cereus]